MGEREICKYCKYWRADPILVDPKKILKCKDPAFDAISKKLNEFRAKAGECSRRSPSFTLIEYDQWSALQNDNFCNKFEKKMR
jgi:hypothetical protein